jgi:LytS/YehU family sensor histidine kinase
MIVQPYVENAIKHGLFNKERDQKLKLTINQKRENSIEFVVEDNGIGREQARMLRAKRNNVHTSFSMVATNNRLKLLNQKFDNTIGVETIDLSDVSGKPSGTRVILTIPILN